MVNGRLPVSTTIAVGVGNWLVGAAGAMVIGAVSFCCGSGGASAAASNVGGGGVGVLLDGAVQPISRKSNKIKRGNVKMMDSCFITHYHA